MKLNQGTYILTFLLVVICILIGSIKPVVERFENNDPKLTAVQQEILHDVENGGEESIVKKIQNEKIEKKDIDAVVEFLMKKNPTTESKQKDGEKVSNQVPARK